MELTDHLRNTKDDLFYIAITILYDPFIFSITNFYHDNETATFL